jgi:hypothetical protein
MNLKESGKKPSLLIVRHKTSYCLDGLKKPMINAEAG